MTLLWIPLLSLFGSIISSLTGNLTRNQSTGLTLLMPVIALALTVDLAPAVFAGEIIRYNIEWVPILGLNLSLRLDGLALLFVFMILGIGLLVVFYTRYYSLFIRLK